MHRKVIVLLSVVLLGLPALGSARDARSIIEKVQAKQLERWSDVDIYLVEQAVVGSISQTYFQRTEVTDDSGNRQTLFLPVSNSRLHSGKNVGGQSMSAAELEAFASAAEMTGSAAATGIEDGLAQAGLPPGLLAASGSDPTATFDPRVIMGANAEFLRGAAAAKRQSAAEDSTGATEAANHMERFIETAKIVGTESVDGKQAYHLRADNIGEVQEVDGRQFEMKTMSLWVDESEYVVLRMKIDGTLTSGAETKPITIENQFTDYRLIPGSKMYEPFKQVIQISGMMDEEQQDEMQEAQVKMAEFEEQMAGMSESQRKMTENMMGPQLEMMRSMASGGGFRTEIVTNSITVNPEMPGSNGDAHQSGALPAGSQAIAPAAQSLPASTAGSLTAMVQQDLTTLGYNTGNTDGEMTTQTAVAISKFQAENNLEVTGKVTPQLAGILSAKVSSKAPAATPAADPAVLKAAQQACLKEKMEATQATKKKKRGFGSLLSGVSKVAGRMGNFDLVRATGDIYAAGAASEDFSQAAKDLGLTEDDIAACQNPM